MQIVKNSEKICNFIEYFVENSFIKSAKLFRIKIVK